MAFVPSSYPSTVTFPACTSVHYVDNRGPDADSLYYVYSPNDNSHSPCSWPVPYDNVYSTRTPPIGDPNPQTPPFIAPRYPPVPLHAPTPLSGQPSSLLIPGAAPPQTTSDKFTGHAPLDQFQIPPPPNFTVTCQPTESFPQPEPSATRPVTATFPTPSALLIKLSTSSTDSEKCESRKARRRSLAQNTSFDPAEMPLSTSSDFLGSKPSSTESARDTISSHEKKRHYLECLEYYVTYLHQQLTLIGCVPAPLQRPTTSGRGMSSQSIRTLLVHMETLNRRLNQEMLAEEQRFIHLRSLAEQLNDTPQCFGNSQP